MRKMNTSLVLCLCTLFIIFSPKAIFSNTLKTDKDRVDDIHKIAALVEEYKKANRNLPFSENWQNVPDDEVAVPILVHMSSYELPEEFRYPPAGMSAIVITTDEFEKYLSKGLKRTITLPRDDRPIVTSEGNWPYFYQFKYDGHNYFVACYLNTALPHTRKLSDNLYKYEVGSIEIMKRKTKKFSEIYME